MLRTGRMIKCAGRSSPSAAPYEVRFISRLTCPAAYRNAADGAAGFDGVPVNPGSLPVRHRFSVLRLALAEVITGGALTSMLAECAAV